MPMVGRAYALNIHLICDVDPGTGADDAGGDESPKPAVAQHGLCVVLLLSLHHNHVAAGVCDPWAKLKLCWRWCSTPQVVVTGSCREMYMFAAGDDDDDDDDASTRLQQRPGMACLHVVHGFMIAQLVVDPASYPPVCCESQEHVDSASVVCDAGV